MVPMWTLTFSFEWTYMEMSIERPAQATNSSYKLQDTSQPICKILKLPSYKLQIFRTDRFSGLTFPTRLSGIWKYIQFLLIKSRLKTSFGDAYEF